MNGLTVKDTQDFFDKFKQTDRRSRAFLLMTLLEYQRNEQPGAELTDVMLSVYAQGADKITGIPCRQKDVS